MRVIALGKQTEAKEQAEASFTIFLEEDGLWGLGCLCSGELKSQGSEIVQVGEPPPFQLFLTLPVVQQSGGRSRPVRR